jgi:hemerythrin-like domain-containing protein
MVSNGREEDLLDLLMQEHREVEGLLTQVRHAGTAQQRRSIADQLIATLVRHALVEETFVVPLIRDYLIHGEESVALHLGEHRELEQLLRDLEGLDGSTHRFMEVVLELQFALAHHFAVEEGQQFPRARLAAPAGELISLRERVLGVGHVAALGAELHGGSDALQVDPGEGMVDRVRDALSGQLAS